MTDVLKMEDICNYNLYRVISIIIEESSFDYEFGRK